jgi:membrane protein required for colicin V production
VALCVWILAFWLAFTYCQNLDPWLKSYVKDQSARNAIGFIIILFATLLVGGVVNALLSFLLKRAGLSGTDKTLGMLFGFIRGVFIVALIMVAVKMTSLPYQQYSKESMLYARFDPAVDLIYAHLPEFIKKMKAVDKTETITESIIDTEPVA